MHLYNVCVMMLVVRHTRRRHEVAERRRAKPRTVNMRFQLVIDQDLLEQVRKLAETERRTVSNMLVVLVDEALRAREKESAEGNYPLVLVAA